MKRAAHGLPAAGFGRAGIPAPAVSASTRAPRFALRAPGVALAWLAGTLAVHQLPALPSGPVLAACAVLGAAACVSGRTRWLAVALAAFVWTALAAERRLDDRLAPGLAGRDVAVTGWVDGFPDAHARRTVFPLRTAPDDRPAGVPARLRLSWYELDARLAPGDVVTATVRLREPRGLANAGAFDYERWLLVEGYGATGYVRAGTIDAHAHVSWAQRWLEARAAIAARIDAAIAAPRAAALVTALAIGERGAFTDADWETLRRTGTSHLVAISGLHVGLVTALVFLVLRRLALALPARAAAHDLAIAGAGSAAAAVVYAALAGFGLPTQRAVVMVLAGCAVLVARRPVGLFDGLAVALVAVLVAAPLAPLTASFWLSFGAVALLLGVAARRPRAEHGRVRTAAREAARLQLKLSLGLVPVTAAFFGEVSLLAPIVNLVAIPLFCFALVPLCLVSIVVLGVPGLAEPVLALAGHAAGAVRLGLEHAAALPWAAVTLPGVSAVALGAALAAVAAVLPAHALPGRHVALLGLAGLVLPAGIEPADGTARVTVFDVGHGLAVAIETRAHRLLYDAGPRYASGFDTGREIVVPALERARRAPLDMLVVGHGDVDHAGGMRAVLDAYPGARLVHGPDLDDAAGTRCRAGMRWRWDGVELEMLHPPAEFTPLGNESSCVLKVTAGTDSLLVTGDIESRAEARLTADPNVRADLRADVVVVPHHGSATSSSRAFVAAVAPGLAVVSAGYDNRWGFPRPAVRQRWRDAGAVLVTTGDTGQISFTLGTDARIEPAMQRERRRYWRARAGTFPGT